MKILITGHRGMLGTVLTQKITELGHEVFGADLPEYDLTDPAVVAQLPQDIEFIYNCAAFTNVDLCEQEFDKAYAVNALVVKNLAEVFKIQPLCQISTDYVFSGKGESPYLENDPTGPRSSYGMSKLAGEKLLQELKKEQAIIVRTAWLYGPYGKNFVETMLELATKKSELRVVNDQRGTPTYTRDLAEALVKFIESPARGIFHFTNSGETTWYEFAREIVRLSGLPTQIVPCTTEEYPRPARRPAYSVLSLERIKKELEVNIPSWQESLQKYLQEREQKQ